MNLFNNFESLSLDGMLVITCERSRVGWNRGLKLGPRGRPMSDEHRAKIGAGNRGKTLSAEHAAAIRARNVGRTHSAETRAKMAAANTGRSLKGEIMTPWGKYNSSIMARECGNMLGIKNTKNKITLGLKTDPENYYYIKAAK